MNIFAKMRLNNLQKKAKALFEKRESGANVNVKYEIKVLKDLAKFYLQHCFDKKLPNGFILIDEYYRAAAKLDDAEAQYLLGQRRLELGKFWQAWHEGNYGEPTHRQYADICFKEAFDCLTEADKNGYPLAKRLYGLAYINGWGVAMDQEKGFKMVVDSIEEANAWDKATEIFKELGLNKPEFFSTMIQMRKK